MARITPTSEEAKAARNAKAAAKMREWRSRPENARKDAERARAYREANRELCLERNRAFNQRRQQQHPEYYMWARAKRRARDCGVPFDITVEDICIPAMCPALGIPIERSNVRGTSLRNSPSLDRIVPALGYVKGNVIVVSHKANSIKNDATPNEVMAVGKFYVDLQRKEGRDSPAEAPIQGHNGNSNSD